LGKAKKITQKKKASAAKNSPWHPQKGKIWKKGAKKSKLRKGGIAASLKSQARPGGGLFKKTGGNGESSSGPPCTEEKIKI